MAEDDGRIVRACPACGTASGFRDHTQRGSQFARDPDAYAETDHTCKGCGAYLDQADVVERPPQGPTGGGRHSTAGRILARPDVTTIEQARRVAEQRREGDPA